MIFFFSCIFLINSSKQCEIDDYFCSYINKIEDRWNNPQNNLTDTISNEIQNLTDRVEKFSISNNTQSNINIIFTDDSDNIDINSKLIPSYLLRKKGEYNNTEKDTINSKHYLKRVLFKTQPSLDPDFGKGYKINGQKGIFYYMLDNEVPLHKIVISNVENKNCSVKLYAILIENQTFNAKPLIKGINGVQEYILPKDQVCGGFKVEVLDNYGDNFTCFNGISAFRTI